MSRPAPDARSAVAAGGRIVVIAGTSAALAEAFAARERFTPVAIVTGPDVLRAGRSARTLLGQADTCVLHTVSWSRQMHPQLFQAVLALAPAATLLVADDDSGTIRSTPTSVNFCTTHSGRAPFVTTNPTPTAGDRGSS